MRRFITMILVFIAFISCHGPTSPENNVEYSGSIKLIDLHDTETIGSGVTIAVFDKDMNDITWDYRKKTPIHTSLSREDGSFQFTINTALYDDLWVVFLYEGYSIEEFLFTETKRNISLYENLNITGLIDYPIVLDSSHDLFVLGNTYFATGSSLTIQEPSNIWIAPEATLTISSQFSSMNSLKVTSSSNAYSYGQEVIERYQTFEIQSNTIVDYQINNLNCSYGIFAFSLRKSDINLENCSFYNSDTGLFVTNATQIVLDKITCCYNNTGLGLGVSLENTNNLEIKNSTITDNIDGVKVLQAINIKLNNSIIADNRDVGYLSWYSTGNIRNNEFENNSVSDFELYGNNNQGILSIEYNNIKSSIGINQTLIPSWHPFNTMTINHNNFINNDTFIQYYSYLLDENVNASNNYFSGINNEADIRLKVIDTYTEGPPPVDIIVTPFTTRLISSAGIQN